MMNIIKNLQNRIYWGHTFGFSATYNSCMSINIIVAKQIVAKQLRIHNVNRN